MKKKIISLTAFVFVLFSYTHIFSQTNIDGFTQQTYTNAANTYNFTYWDANFKTTTSSRKFTNHTSSYNLNIDYTNLNINSLDVNLNNAAPVNAFQEANATTFQTLQAGAIDYKIRQNGSILHAKTATPTKLGVKISQMAEYGTWLNRRVVDSLNFTNAPSIYGSFSGIEFTNWHNRFKITFHLKPRTTISNGQLELSVQMPSVFSQAYNSGNIYGFAKSTNGEGFALKGGSTAANVSVVGNTITVQTALANLNADTPYELSLIFYAVKTNFSTAYVAAADDAANVGVSISQSLPSARSVTTNYSADEGLYFVEVPSYWMGYGDCNAIDGLQNLKLTLNNTNVTDKRVRLCFRQNPAPNIVGFSSMLRNPNGDPAGLPLQISKNWHSTTAMLYSGTWIREYTEVVVPANTTLKFDYTRIGARWGKVHSAFSHQLSVVGEGVTRGGWLEAGIGSFGENITHSPDYEYGNSNICDYRPLLVTNNSYGGTSRQCFWTGNTGAMDMFVYNDNSNTRIYQSQVKTLFKKYGPNLTETSISTYSSDNKLKLDYTFFLNRSDDFVRVFYKVKIKALQNTPFSRFDIFQLGSDTYNYRKAQSLVYGNDAGLVGQFTPSNAGSNAYSTAATALTGTNPWIWSGDGLSLDGSAELSIPTNNAIIIRSYNASLGGQSVNTPYFRERSSSHWLASKPTQYCLVPPPNITSFVQGDWIELLVEAVCLPKQAIDYYGPNTAFRQALTQYGNTWELLYREVLGNKINASSPTNSINTNYPLTVTTTNNTGLVIVTGGKGYMPIVFKDLTNISNPNLWKAKSNCWELVNQANYGKDFWQTEYDAETGLFNLIYNVNQDTTNDNTNIIKYYLGNTPPMPSMVLQSSVNQSAISMSSNITANERDTVVFTPQVTENSSTSNGNGGRWQWTGVNGYTANIRAISLNRLQMTDAGNYTVTYTDTFGCKVATTFQLSVNVKLPVALNYLKATPLSKSNLLTWATNNETNNKGFEIQRQEVDGKWLAIGFVATQGKISIYNFEDNTPLSISYYRLRQIDFDGTETLSKIVSVQRTENGIVYIAPNPTSSKVHISLSTNQPIKSIHIYDLSGRNILSQKIDNLRTELDFSAFAKGVYIIEIQSGSKVFREKIVRQ